MPIKWPVPTQIWFWAGCLVVDILNLGCGVDILRCGTKFPEFPVCMFIVWKIGKGTYYICHNSDNTFIKLWELDMVIANSTSLLI